MDALSLPLNDHRLLFSLDDFLSTPAIDDGDPEHWHNQIDLMIQREFARRDFVDGALSPDDFMEALFQYGVDPIHAAEAWEEGRRFM